MVGLVGVRDVGKNRSKSYGECFRCFGKIVIMINLIKYRWVFGLVNMKRFVYFILK